MTALKIDVRTKPVGYHFGGTRKAPIVVIECPKCGKPALELKESKKGGYTTKTYAHTFAIALNGKNEPETTYGVLHTLSDAPEEPKHACGWPGCDVQIVLRYWACFAHWYKLPGWVRGRITNAYVPGQKLPDGLATLAYKEIGKLR